MLTFSIVFFSIVAVLIIIRFRKSKSWREPKNPFPKNWRIVIAKDVAYYNTLTIDEKNRFEYKIQEFLLNCRITGINTNVEIEDKLLVAASAVIPIFEFRNWRYTNLYEVLLYPGMFNDEFETEGPDRRIMGMVGTGYMEGKMVLSKQALHHGFKNESDKKNTAIHEFVHLIDKSDGSVDGIPAILLEKQYVIPWLDLINRKIEEIYENKSDINPYGGTNKLEFFAVISEYFFERPKLLAQKHPQLYKLLEEIFNQDMKSRDLNKNKLSIGRNDPCPCGSDIKFKNCCGKST